MFYKGHILNPGYGKGRIFELSQIRKTLETESFLSVFGILEKFNQIYQNGIKNLEKDIEQQSHIGNVEGKELLEAYQLILKDEDLIDRIKTHIKNGLDIKTSIQKSFSYYQEMISNMGNEYLSLRAQDLNDVASYLLEEDFILDVHEDIILVAEDLSPKEVMNLPILFVKGIVLTNGHPYSHSAILLRNLNIPVLYQCEVKDRLHNQVGIITEGGLCLGKDMIEVSLPKKENRKSSIDYIHTIQKNISLSVAITKNEEMETWNTLDIYDVGLYRSEWIYLSLEQQPNVNTLIENYQRLSKDPRIHSLRIRIADLGEDKIPSFMKETIGEKRGCEVYRAYPEILLNQLEALVAISKIKNIKVLIPMLEELQDILNIKERIHYFQSKDPLTNSSSIILEGMIETPRGFENRLDILQEVSGIMIGTSDFYSHCLGISRFDLKEEDFSLIEVENKLLQLIKDTRKVHKRIGLCGGLLNRKEGVQKALSYQVDELCIQYLE